MPNYSKKKINQLLSVSKDATATTADRGKALEDLTCYLFEKFPTVLETRRNSLNQFHTEEMDVAFFNDLNASNPLNFLGTVILIECKNWSGRVGSAEISYFGDRLKHRGNSVGILVAANGITGVPAEVTRANFELAMKLAEGCRILVVTEAQISTLKSTDDLVRVLQGRMCELVVAGAML